MISKIVIMTNILVMAIVNYQPLKELASLVDDIDASSFMTVCLPTLAAHLIIKARWL